MPPLVQIQRLNLFHWVFCESATYLYIRSNLTAALKLIVDSALLSGRREDSCLLTQQMALHAQAAPVSNCHMLGVNQGSVKKKKEVRRWFICDGGGCRLMRFLARVLQVSGCQWERGNHANPLVSSVPPRKVHHHKLCPFKWKWPGDERCKQICRWRIGCTWAIFPPGSPLCLCAVLRSLSDPYSAVAAQQKKGRVTRGTRAIS